MRSFFTAALLVATATAADVAPRPIKVDPACRADGDCVLTHFQGCCGGPCCPTAPRAMAAAEVKRQQDRCAVIECAAQSCPDVKCAAAEPDASFRAVCRQYVCVAERVSNPTPPVECQSADDCTVEYPSAPCSNAGPCGCCPGTEPRAVAKASVRPPPPPSPGPRQTQPSGDPKFGLSQGGATAPNCAPCPARRAATATCNAGRCSLVRMRPPPPG